MNNSTRRALDIALATEARGMYAGMLSAEEKQRIGQMRNVQEFLNLLSRNEAWRAAALSLQSGELTDARFSDAVSRCVFDDYGKLYRFANEMSRQFLKFVTLDVELRAILRALRRVASPQKEETAEQGAPPVLRDLPGHNFERLRRAKTWDDIVAAVSGSIYSKALASLTIDEKTGMPSLTDAVAGLEAGFYDALSRYVRTGYTGPSKKELADSVSFRADMLNISYIMRLRRFNATSELASKLLLPVYGSVTAQIAKRALEADSDEEAFAVLRSTKSGKWLPDDGASVEAMIRSAQNAYFKKVLHGPLNLAAVYAFLTLKEYEGDMLRRVFVALHYGLSPAEFME